MYYFNSPLTRNLVAGSSMSRKEKFYEQVNHRRTHTFMPPDEAASGKKSYWPELEITGNYDILSGSTNFPNLLHPFVINFDVKY